ncbi:MAG: site-specific integrase [Lutisporaceae bacterium]
MTTYSGHIRKRPTKKSENRWQIVIELGYDPSGKRQRIFKTVEGTKKDASAAMTEMLNELNKGTYIEPSKMTLTQYLRDWLQTYAVNLSPTTVAGYTVNIENHIIPYLGHVLMQQIQSIQVQKMYEYFLRKPLRNDKIGLSPRSIKYIHTTLHEALSHAVRMQIIVRNVTDFVTTPKQKKYRSTAYEEEQALELLEISKGTDMEAPITLALGLGLRRGELLGLKWHDIDFKNKQVRIINNLIYANKKLEFKDPKSESGIRTLEMPEGMIAILKRHQLKQKEYRLFYGSEYQENDLVCCYEDGQPYIPGTFSTKFTRFLSRNNLPKIRLHDLRHTNASLMLQYGVPAKVASQRLGHSTIGITMDLYSHVIGDMQKDAASKINIGIFQKSVIEKVAKSDCM